MIPKRLIYFVYLFELIFIPNILYCQDTISLSEKNYKLLLASYNGQVDSILYWLNLGADVNTLSSDGITPLNYAIYSGNIDAVKALVLNGADVNYYSFLCLPPIFLATSYNQANIVEFLLSKNAKTDILIKKKVSVLHYAIKYADTNIVNMLIKSNINLINLKDEDNNTPLHIAVFFKRYDVVDILLRYTKNVSVPDKYGITPLLLSIYKSDTLMAKKLLFYGAKPNETSNKGYGIYEFAVLSENNEMIDWVFKNFNSSQKPGNSLIKLAYFTGNRQLVKTLKSNGIPDYYGLAFQNMHLGFSELFTYNDFMFGVQSKFTDFKYGLLFSLNYNWRFWKNRILVTTDEPHTYLQFWEKRQMIGSSIEKRIKIIDNQNNTIYLLPGAYVYYTFGKYNGSLEKPESYAFISPSLTVFIQSKIFAYSFGIEYFKFKDIKANPIHIKFCQLITIPFYKFNKNISW